MKRQPCADIPNATTWRCKIIKTKLGGEYTEEVKAPFIFGQGFATALELENLAKSYGLLSHSAGQSRMKWVDSEEKGEPIHPEVGKGKQACIDMIVANPWLQKKLRAACLYHANADTAPTLEELLAMGPPEELDEQSAEDSD